MRSRERVGKGSRIGAYGHASRLLRARMAFRVGRHHVALGMASRPPPRAPSRKGERTPARVADRGKHPTHLERKGRR